VLLALADALIFTLPSDLGSDAFGALLEGVRLVTSPFVSETAEEDLLVRLLTTGWNLAPESSGAPLDQ
jgi:hypothetical protein